MKKNTTLAIVVLLVIAIIVILSLSLKKNETATELPNTDPVSGVEIINENGSIVDLEAVMQLLTTKSWAWTKTEMEAEVVEPKVKDAFVVTFNNDMSLNFTTDCNNGFGSYVITGSDIEFSPMGTTMMYCQDSQEGEFLEMISKAKSYAFSSTGELVFMLDEGMMIFE